MTFVEQEVLSAITEMVRERAAKGNAQSKHGEEAALSFEIFLFTQALNALMDQQ